MEVTHQFRFRGVIFDLDGTLIDSHAAMMRAYEIWAEEYDLDLDELPKYLGMPNSTLAEKVLPPDIAPTAAARIEALEVEGTDGVIALPGSVEAFDTLPREIYAIGTSCTSDLLRSRATAAGLDLPPVVATRDQVVNGKPAPDTFLLACERLGFTPDEVLVFEDAPAGVAAARAAGCAVVGVTSTQTAETLQADAHITCLADVTWAEDTKGYWLATV